MATMDMTTVETLLAHSEFVRGLARVLVRDSSHADDAVQQAWLEACERPPRRGGDPRGWLATVTRNAVRKIRRSESRRGEREIAAARPERLPSAAEIAEREEVRRNLVDAVLALAEPYRSAIVLRYLQELAPRDIAARLEVPVETVRTRIKRGLEQLRGALDRSFDGDRRAWGLALLPWAGPTIAKAKLGGAAAVMVAGALVVGALGGAWAIGSGGAGATRSEPAMAVSARSLNAVAAPAAVRVEVGGVGAGQVAAGGVDRSAPSERRTGVATTPPQGPSQGPPQGKAGKLDLTTELDRPSVGPRDKIELRVTFTNRGAEALRFYTPEHIGRVAFPTLRLIADDGTAYGPSTPPFQSMWTTGIQGTIRELQPGKHWTTVIAASQFHAAAAEAGARLNPESLPPGRYRVECSYRQATDEVPCGGLGFEKSRKRVEGLWTGEVAAPELWLAVTGGSSPSLAVRPVEAAIAGGPALVGLTVRNPGSSSLPLGELRVSMHSKAYGGGEAVVAPTALVALDQKPLPVPLVVAAGSELRVQVDLARLAFASTRGEVTRRFGLYELSPQGIMSCSAAWQRDQNAEPLRSTAWVKILPCGVIAAKVLELTVAPAGGTSVLLRLTNTGTTPVRIRTRLSWPSDLSVAFVDAEKKRGSRRAVSMKGGLMVSTGDPDPAPIVVGLAWAGDEYERPGPLGASDFGVLPVGGMVSRTLDLAKLIDGAIPAGRYEVRASWRSTTDGRHLGLEPALVGVVNSQPLVLRIE